MDEYLRNWGFPQLIDTFKEQEIDEEALLCLTEESLKDVIPKIGPRMKFLAKLREHQNLNAMPVILDQEDDIGSPNSSFGQTLENSFGSSPSSSSVQEDVEIVDIDVDVENAYKEGTKRSLAFCGMDNFKKACRSVYHLDMEKFLSKTLTGKFILSTYKKEKRFTSKMRNQLTSLLVSGLISDDRTSQLTPTDFEILSEKICFAFPTETKETYYVPRVPALNKQKAVNARGKLIDKYRNFCRMYNTIREDASTAEESSTSIDDHDANSDAKKSALWLTKWQEPWNEVLKNWEQSFVLRQKNRSNTVEEFIKEWPVLKHKDAYTLVDMDFKQMFANSELSSLIYEYEKWDNFFVKIMNLKKNDKALEEFLEPLSSDISQDSKNALQIAALSMIFPPVGRIRYKKVHWKASTVECQESLINLVPAPGNIEECILKRRAKLASFHLTVQPFIVVIGASFTEVTDAYLIIDNSIYRTHSVLQALDFAFKTFHALNVSYPNESEHIWFIIERVLYKINCHSKITIPLVQTILKDLENI